MSNIEPGKFLTVVKWVKGDDRSYIGDVFKLLSSDGSLLHVVRETGGVSGKRTMVLNTDEVQVRVLDDGFVRRVLNDCTCLSCCCCRYGEQS